MNGSSRSFAVCLNTGFTLAPGDGTNTHIHGNKRGAKSTGIEYFLADALGSMLQLADRNAQTYYPYGVVTTTSGGSYSAYRYAAEYKVQSNCSHEQENLLSLDLHQTVTLQA